MSSKYSVIGYPIGHSMSPFIHKELFSLKSINAEYNKLEIAPERLSRAYEEKLRNLDGFNVTIPYKTDIISFLDGIDDEAREYGAVNTVYKKNGKLFGYNTDAYGFLNGLAFSGIELSGRVAVFGYGGAARTIITECLKANCDVTILTTDDRKEKACKVALKIENKIAKLPLVATENQLRGEYDLLINASPVGMYPNVNFSPVNEECVDHFSAVYDIVYNPQKTMLLKAAEKKGKKFGDGLSMLVCQAEQAEKIWLGVDFLKEETERIIKMTSNKINEEFGI